MNAFIFIVKTVSLVAVLMLGFLGLMTALGGEGVAENLDLCTAPSAKTCLISIF